MRNSPFNPLGHLDYVDHFKKARKFEKQLAKEINGKRQPASGATPFAKGDIKTSDCLIEVKQTGKSHYSVSLKILHKIRKEALEERRIPILLLDIQSEKFVVMRLKDAFERRKSEEE